MGDDGSKWQVMAAGWREDTFLMMIATASGLPNFY